MMFHETYVDHKKLYNNPRPKAPRAAPRCRVETGAAMAA
jgi:hypothetical protein